MTNSYSTAVFVGDHPLVVACAGRAREAGLRVIAASTQERSIADWAAAEGIARVEWSDLAEFLEEQRPDVLFSVGNLRILPDDMVNAVKVAINFHDGPLPKFAGLHTPMWALVEGETDYAVTWHVVEGGIDEGDVLASQGFEISADETTRSMNIKCMGAAGGAFNDVLAQLAAGAIDRKPQVGEGQYFGRYDRPLPGGVLVPHQMSASQIDRYVRALDFGSTLNRVGRPLLQIDEERLMVVGSVSPASTAAADTTAGTVLAATETDGVSTLTVATATDALDLVGWAEPGVDVASLVHAVLPDPTSVLADIEKLHASSSRSEVWWSKQLTGQTPVELAHLGAADEEWGTAVVSVPLSGFDTAAAVAGAFALSYSGQGSLTVGLATPVATDDTLRPWFNTVVPLTVSVDPDATTAEALAAIEANLVEAREHGPYLRDLSLRMPAQVDGPIQPSSPAVALLHEGAASDAALQILIADDGSTLTVRARGAGVAERISEGLSAFAAASVSGSSTVFSLPILGEAETAEILGSGRPSVSNPFRGSLHKQFLASAAATPDAIAVVHGAQEISYAELEKRARRVSAQLASRGVESGAFVGVSTAPSLEMLVGVLGVLMSGCAYVPLDPRFPTDRLAFMVDDAQMDLVLTDGTVSLGPGMTTLDIGTISTDAGVAPRDILPEADASSLAYMMYTSGSTGSPKGVMVSHANVDSFLGAMEPHLGRDDGVWLSVTTLSFDISVLELFYPLVHGWKVVLYEGLAALRPAEAVARPETRLDISLFFFGSEGIEGGGSYEVLLESARYADTHGFAAVWTPERHFNAFGGPFPNPSVTGAALAAITENVDIRSGSCVLPLHHPARVAEEWAVVDQLSHGRVGLSIAAGWHSDDFIYRPQNFGQSKATLIDQIEELRALWRGEAVTYPGPKGDVDVTTLPRPVQANLPIWYTTAGNVESFILAGQKGFNLLTHLLGQSIDDLRGKVQAYRKAWVEAGHDGTGTVSLMLHTFVAADGGTVRDTVREPMKSYLRDSIMLVKDHASEFPTFDPTKTEADGALMGLTPEDLNALLEVSFGRYFETSGLFGSVPEAVAFAEEVAEIDVDEIAALVDFGIDGRTVLENLTHLNDVREVFLQGNSNADPETYGSLMVKHGVTHLQCTPSEARIVLADPGSKQALGSLTHMLVGGEACPVSVASELRQAVGGELINVYGPTETTIWSTIHHVGQADIDANTVPIGVPLDNTSVRVVAETGQLLPVGAVGELVLGGDGVTGGYYQRGELTAERFVERADTDGVVYRTGDLVSWNNDATLMFHGRADSQVKVRGHRIELGEIESALESRHDVREAVVVVEGEGDTAALVAHLVAAGEAGTDHEIGGELAVSLPSHMVPERFVWRDVLPTTPNGKVDRKALAEPTSEPEVSNAEQPSALGAERPARSEPSAALDAGELAGLIESAWQEVLGLDKIDRFKSFFDHGGNSLQVVSLRDKLEEHLDRSVSLVDLFRYGSVNELAEAFATVEDVDTSQEDLVSAASSAPSSGERANRRAAARRKARKTK